MLLSSIVFLLYFLPPALLGHTLLQLLAQRPGASGLWGRAATAWLAIVSLFFYAWGEPRHLLLLGLSLLFNYGMGLCIEPRRGKASGRRCLALAVAGNLAFLVYYKYANFLVASGGLEIWNALAPGGLALTEVARVAQPLGVSFFTFKAVSYVMDVHRGKTAAVRDPVVFTAYLALFTQILAGPIDRFATLGGQLVRRVVDRAGFADGVGRFVMGLGKKVLIADTVAKAADAAFAVSPGELTFGAAWAGVLAYTLQIYFDFSGYSDMAIGLGRMLGLKGLENFNYPYIAQNIREFWQRWHISLSTWFRDYLYIPLGGNRRGELRTTANLMAVFVLCGLWHGASWMFLGWGVFHGVFIGVERVAPGLFDRMPRALRHGYTLLAVMAGWVLFRATSFGQALEFYQAMAGLGGGGRSVLEVTWHLHSLDVQLAALAGLLLSLPLAPWLEKRVAAWAGRRGMEPLHGLAKALALAALLIACLAPLAGKTFQPFIYLNF